MNRRDTILIAVLINAGLLVILFATAMTGDPQIAALPEAPVTVAVEEPVTQVVEKPKPIPALVLSLPAEPKAEPVKIAPKVAPKPQYVQVTVKRGDSLDKIARVNGTTIAALMQVNGLTDSRLQIGQVLRVPLSKKAAEKSPVEPGYYVVESGDNPWLLATKLHIPLDDLLELNQLDEERARRLKPGDRIRIK